jgi:hypothetical protein
MEIYPEPTTPKDSDYERALASAGGELDKG